MLVAKYEDDATPLIDNKIAKLSINTNLVILGPLSKFMSMFAHFFTKQAGNKSFEVYLTDPEQGVL